MSAKSTVWPEVVDALLSTLRADSAFRDPEVAGTEVPVLDAAEPLDSTEPTVIVVGSGYGEQAGQSGRFDRQWAHLGSASQVEENGTVNGYLFTTTGDSDAASALRLSAVALLDVLSAALPSAEDLGVAEVLWMELDGGPVTQVATEQGIAVVIEFNVTYQARLT